MQNDLLKRLAAVRRRQQAGLVVRSLLWGAICASALGASLALLAWVGWIAFSTGHAVALVAAGAVLGGASAWLRPRRFEDAARALDRTHGLKDRTISALEFSRYGRDGELHHLQLADALAHLDHADPRRAVPWRWPRTLVPAVAAAAAAVLLTWLPRGAGAGGHAQTRPGLLADDPAVEEQTEAARERIQELKEELREQAAEDPVLQELLEKLEQEAAAMQEAPMDLRSGLASLSAMQAAMQAWQARLDGAGLDEKVARIGKALQQATAFQKAGKAMEAQDLDAARSELERLDTASLGGTEARSLAERLASTARDLNAGAAGATDPLATEVGPLPEAELMEATAKLAEALGECEAGACEAVELAADELARCLGRCAGRKKAAAALGACCQGLAACKGGMCQGRRNGGPKGEMKQGSDRPSLTWGRSSSGNIDGERTRIDATRRIERITGKMGAGPSTRETETTPEGRQEAQRAWQERYAEYQKMSEAVLESEAIPLGHRETIRRYFELIRPASEDR